MNEVPPNQDPDYEVDDLYRRASALDPSRPSESVRRRVLDLAAQLAAERAAVNRPAKFSFARRSYRSSWRPAIFGTLAAAALAGLLFVPEFLMPHGPGTVFSPDQAALQKAVQAPAVQAPAAPAPAASGPAARAPAATVVPPAPPRALAEAPTQYAADEPLVPAQREQAQSALKARASARNAAPVADSAAPIAAKNEPAELQGGADSATSIAAKNAPAQSQGVTATQSTAAASGGAATEERRARTAISAMTGMAPPPTAARAAPAAREPTERMQVTAGRPMDPAAELRRAAEIGDVAKLQTLLDRQSVVDARDEDGRTALMLATLHGRAHAVDVLLAHGSDPNAADARGTTPLQAALAGHQTAIATALQRAGAR
jgi:ankyrin repeat protein